MTTDGQISFDDTFDGGAGSDTLFIRDEGGVTGAFTSTNVETINARNDAVATVELDNAAGYTALVASAPGAALTFDEIKAAGSLSLDVESNSGGNNVTFTFADDELDGTADAVSSKLSGNSGDFDLNIGDGNGTIETLNIEAASDNTGTTTLAGDAPAVATVNVTGSGEVNLAGGLTSETIDASAATGDVSLVLGTADQTITGGSGADTFDFDGNIGNADTVDGGAGTDVLALATVTGAVLDGTANGNVENVSNVETLRLTDEITAAAQLTIDMSQIDGLTNVDFFDFSDQDTNETHTITNLLNGAVVVVGDAGTADTAIDADLAVGFATNSSNNNLTIQLEEGDIDVLTDLNGFVDTLTIASTEPHAGGDSQIDDMSGFDADSLVITGDEDLDLNNNALSAATSDVNASAFTGNLLVQASTTSTEITGGSGDDNIAGGAGSDVLSGGDGADTLTFQSLATSADTLTGGAGLDTFVHGNGTAETANAATITDFSTDDPDNLDLDISSIESLHVVAGQTDDVNLIDGNAANVTAAAAITTVEVDADGDDPTLSAGDEMVVLTGETFADATAALAAIGAGESHEFTLASAANDNDGILIGYEDTNGDFRVAVGQTNAASTDSGDFDGLVDIVTLTGVSANDALNNADFDTLT